MNKSASALESFLDGKTPDISKLNATERVDLMCSLAVLAESCRNRIIQKSAFADDALAFQKRIVALQQEIFRR
jgi:hypothetical protein